MWLDEQPDNKLKFWLSNTKVPFIATMPNGEILWCNESFENYLGWTSVELVGRQTWVDLTATKDDLADDLALVKESLEGKRNDYQLQKAYRTKSGGVKQSVIDVLRYPQYGEFECFLVAVFPMDHGLQYALAQIGEMQTLMIALMNSKPDGVTWEKAMTFGKEHPVIASILGTVFGVLLFGERVIEIIKLFGVKIGE